MSTRYTRKDAEQAMRVLATQLGRPIGHYAKCAAGESNMGPDRTITTIPRGWELSQAYGGYEIQELADVPGETWVSTPMGSGHKSAREICQACSAAIEALRIRERDERIAVSS